MRIEDIAIGQTLAGVEPEHVVTVEAVAPLGPETVRVIYRLADGALRERLVTSAEAETIQPAATEKPFAFDGDAEAFRLAVEAKRIDLAFLFDPMVAVHTSNVEPLPHQITAVYEAMLPKQPLRYVLADDPGAGKTIMAGLYIRELVMRADAHRILIVAPGSLVEQWRDEMYEKFGMEFRIFSRQMEEAEAAANPFEVQAQLIVRLDQFARNEELQEKLCAAGWDMVVFDEAHKLAAHFSGGDVEKTARFRFAERLGAHTRHLLLMTATPHNGKEEEYQLFLSLLDSDRFYGRFRDGVHKVDASDLMRRMMKEELVKFDGTPLFPERRAYTVNYSLSPPEASLYQAVTNYVQTEMGKADQLEGTRKGSVGFALTTLQRRLASSPEAIFQSLRRRRERLEARLREERLGVRASRCGSATVEDLLEDEDELTAEELEALQEDLVDDATAAKTVAELEQEIAVLRILEQQARGLVASGDDRKWDELSKLLQHEPAMRRENGTRRKIIIFSEHRDTLNYLADRIERLLGLPDAVVTIHGGTHRDERLRIQALFRSDPDVQVLVATDAAGEGVNLQVANLMVNYDLPWNPNRLEQRFGRIHRIGQREVCHLWSLVASETREGAVYDRLLRKLETERTALKGRVFDILGDVFEERSLKDLLIDAIRYGDQPEVREALSRRIDSAFSNEHLHELLARNALASETLSPERLFAVKEEMDKAEARKLQPGFVRAFFLRAFESLGGLLHAREADRYEITHVPADIRERDRRISGRNRRDHEPVLRRYERIAFTKEAIQPEGRPGLAKAVLMHPGHPLMLAITDIILERNANLLRQGATLLDPHDMGEEPWLLLMLLHEVRSGDDTVLSRRLQFVKLRKGGTAEFAGWAPHLDLEPLTGVDPALLADVASDSWLSQNVEVRGIAHAAATLALQHHGEVAARRIAHVDKTLAAVNDRLTNEISFWQDRYVRLKADVDAGKDVRLSLENVRRTIEDLSSRLERRKESLKRMRHVASGTPNVIGGALVVPQGLAARLRGQPLETASDDAFSVDPEARKRIEMLAMAAVMRAEEARGCTVHDVSHEKCGWDITSVPPGRSGAASQPRHIEVKGRIEGARTVTVSRNEIFYALNQGDKFILAIVLVGEDDSIQGPYYVRSPFRNEPEWGVVSMNYDLTDLLQRAEEW